MRNRLRGISLVEILVIFAIIAILSAITYSVVAVAKTSAKRSVCLSNLKQVGASLALYEADWDDQNPKDYVVQGPKPRRHAWTLLEAYSKSPAIFMCPNEAGTDWDSLGYIYRSGPRKIDEKDRTPLGIEPSSVTVFCMEHLKRHIIQTGLGSLAEYEETPEKKHIGIFQYLTADGSVHSVDASAVEPWVSDGIEWFSLLSVPPGKNTWVRTFKFPNEPWPPSFQP